jgi:flagellar biosynthesis chaperone FliJ
MKRFRFPLRSVGVVRSAHEMRRREQLSAAIQAEAQAERARDAVRQELRELESVMAAARGTRFRATEQIAFLEAQRRLVDREREAAAALLKASEQREECRVAWLLARRDLRLVENLEQRARAAHRREEEREAQLALDDRTNALASRAASAA